MVSQVDDGCARRIRAEVDIQFVLVVEGVAHLGHEFGGIACLAIGTEVGENHTLTHKATGPFLVSKADAAAVEVMLAVACIEFKLVFYVVNLEAAIGDAVGETSGGLARARTVVVVIPRMGITEGDVFHVAVAVGRDDAHDARTDVTQLHFDTVGVSQGVELNVFIIRGFTPCFYFYIHRFYFSQEQSSDRDNGYDPLLA